MMAELNDFNEQTGLIWNEVSNICSRNSVIVCSMNLDYLVTDFSCKKVEFSNNIGKLVL